ncbi:putative cytochrome c [Emiliania huxleyi CCMP1516]|uniref:Cytochrome c domain-containing protein n=4 Tax=Emiliania huxleyi TaxID=2903 RepID=A0A0D3KVV4_EMIH1|nr:putative cytochrome c [Emiliania huxleyi CCMP1516]EOD39889.1 putative cytochrome c [Emiliania huxleyi CCMP1516]|eukprot:XP_005792318.1 putative cytochrome c [Emiliania huxleyi CCMP1516]
MAARVPGLVKPAANRHTAGKMGLFSRKRNLKKDDQELPLPPGNSAAGAKIFKAKCNTCHTCNEGGPNKQGPNLFGVIGRQCGQVQGFKYTGASKNSGIQWSNQTLVAYLENPKKYIKGTNMAFPGFKKDQDRVDVVAYLNTMK